MTGIRHNTSISYISLHNLTLPETVEFNWLSRFSYSMPISTKRSSPLSTSALIRMFWTLPFWTLDNFTEQSVPTQLPHLALRSISCMFFLLHFSFYIDTFSRTTLRRLIASWNITYFFFRRIFPFFSTQIYVSNAKCNAKISNLLYVNMIMASVYVRTSYIRVHCAHGAAHSMYTYGQLGGLHPRKARMYSQIL